MNEERRRGEEEEEEEEEKKKGREEEFKKNSKVWNWYIVVWIHVCGLWVVRNLTLK